jgi:hypothetical protein
LHSEVIEVWVPGFASSTTRSGVGVEDVSASVSDTQGLLVDSAIRIERLSSHHSDDDACWHLRKPKYRKTRDVLAKIKNPSSVKGFDIDTGSRYSMTLTGSAARATSLVARLGGGAMPAEIH